MKCTNLTVETLTHLFDVAKQASNPASNKRKTKKKHKVKQSEIIKGILSRHIRLQLAKSTNMSCFQVEPVKIRNRPLALDIPGPDGKLDRSTDSTPRVVYSNENQDISKSPAPLHLQTLTLTLPSVNGPVDEGPQIPVRDDTPSYTPFNVTNTDECPYRSGDSANADNCTGPASLLDNKKSLLDNAASLLTDTESLLGEITSLLTDANTNTDNCPEHSNGDIRADVPSTSIKIHPGDGLEEKEQIKKRKRKRRRRKKWWKYAMEPITEVDVVFADGEELCGW